MARLKTGDKDAALIEAAVTLFLEKGVRKTSIKQIADRAGVAVGTFYLYFEDKVSMVRAVAFAFADKHRQFSEEIINSDKPPLDKLELYLLGLYDLWLPFGQNDEGSIDLADAIITHANETLDIASVQFHSTIGACLSECKQAGMRIEDPEQEAGWIALATSPFFPLAGTPGMHPLRGQLSRKDLVGFIAWLSAKVHT